MKQNPLAFPLPSMPMALPDVSSVGRATAALQACKKTTAWTRALQVLKRMPGVGKEKWYKMCWENAKEITIWMFYQLKKVRGWTRAKMEGKKSRILVVFIHLGQAHQRKLWSLKVCIYRLDRFFNQVVPIRSWDCKSWIKILDLLMKVTFVGQFASQFADDHWQLLIQLADSGLLRWRLWSMCLHGARHLDGRIWVVPGRRVSVWKTHRS